MRHFNHADGAEDADIHNSGKLFCRGQPDARDASFQVFYCGINIGGLFGPLLTGWLAQRYNYHVGFMAAGMLMIIGLLSYAVGRRFILKNADNRLKYVIAKPAHPLGKQDYYRTAAAALACCIAGICAVLWLDPATISYVLLALTVGVAGFLMWTMFRSPLVTAAERVRVREFLPIFVCSVVYWCLQSQIYRSEEHTSELQSRGYLVCRLLLEKKKQIQS